MVATGIAAASAAAPQEAPEPEAREAKVRGPSKVTLNVKRHVLAGKKVLLKGRVVPKGRRWVAVRANGRKIGTVRTRRNGTYRLRWTPGKGRYKLFARVARNRAKKGDRTRARRMNAYRRAHASYYGPGLYGNGMACGGTLTPSTKGVAHKTLPCGSKVTLRYRGRTVRVPVIDRGPYVAGRDYDLTEATKRRLGFPGIGVVLSTR